MIRISTVQLSIIPGNIRANFEQIEREIQNARKQNTDILIFPELCLSGYMIGDLWEQNAFLRECERYGQKIADAAENIIVIFGNIAVDPKKKNNDGRVRKYNAAFAACNGQFLKNDRGLSYTIKTLLPDYRQFDDKRHFTSLPELAAEENQSVSSLLAPFTFTIRQETLRAGIVLCEDSWDENARLSPMEILSEKNIDIFSICPPRHSPWKRMIKDTVSSLPRFPASAALCSTSIEEDWKTMEKTAIPMTA